MITHTAWNPPAAWACDPLPQADPAGLLRLAMAHAPSCCGGGAAHPHAHSRQRQVPNFQSPWEVPVVDGLPEAAATGADLVIERVHLCDSGSVRGPVDVHIADGLIRGIRDSGPLADGSDHAPVRYLHAGLIDLHVHLPPPGVLRLPELFALNFLLHGVTTLRSVGDIEGTALQGFVRAIEGTGLPGPRLFYSGPFVGQGKARWNNTLAYQHEHEADDIVARHLGMGANCVKLYENLTPALIRRLVAVGEAAGLRMLGHVPTPLRVEQAHIPEPQHFFGVPAPEALRRDHVCNRTIDWDEVDAGRMDEVVEHALRTGTQHLPTLTVTHGVMRQGSAVAERQAASHILPAFYDEVIWSPAIGLPAYRGLAREDYARAAKAYDKKLELVRRLHRAGASLLMGTDTMQPHCGPGSGLHEEIAHYARAGLDRGEILPLATSCAAERLGTARPLGRIAIGAHADFFISRKNPFDSDWTPARIDQIAVGGRLAEAEALRDAARALVRRHDSALAKPLTSLLARYSLHRAARNFVG